MKKSVFVVFVILMLVLPLVVSLEINVKTIPKQKVSVTINSPGEFDVLEFHQAVAEDGIIVFDSQVNLDEVDLVVRVSNQNGDYLIKKDFAGVVATGKIDLYLPSEDGSTINAIPFVEEVVEEEVIENVEEEIIKEEVVKNEIEVVEEGGNPGGITGNAVSGIKDVFTSKTPYYILGAIIGLFVLVFIIQVGMKRLGSKEKFNVVRYSGDEDKRILDAEIKLAEAKKELDEIKNRKIKLAEAKVRFQKDKAELGRLEGGL